MISEIFKAFLITSLAGTAFAAVISLIRPITKKAFGYSWHYYIWLCVLLVMIMPVRFNANSISVPSVVTQAGMTENTVQPTAPEKPQLLQTAAVIINNRMNILAYLWLIGAAALMLLNVLRYIRLNVRIRENGKIIYCPEIGQYTDKKINVLVWEDIASPFMTGVFRPTLVLPKTKLSGEQLHNILRHEMTHFKRHDVLYKWFAEFVKCVHWFNPIAWYVSKQIAAECEISCDMAVTENMSDSEKIGYINTILFLLPTGKIRQLSLTTQMTGSKNILKRRFIMIKNKKKTGRIVSVISAVIAVVMLSATVFASGVFSDLTTDDYAVEIPNNGDKTEYTVKIPDSWSGKYYIHSENNVVRFEQKATYDKYGGGTLFSIEKTNAGYADEILNMLSGSRLLYKNDKYAYIFAVPTDVQYPIWADRDENDVEIAAEYEEMFKYVTQIADSFKIHDEY